VALPPLSAVTKDNYDLQFGTNVLGHWYLTKLLLPALLAASTPTHKARVVTTSSLAAYFSPRKVDYEIFIDGPRRRELSNEMLYRISKLVRSLAVDSGSEITNHLFGNT
jgi:retinol dehydrogenase 12